MSFLNIAGQLVEGLGGTCLIFFLTLIFSMPLGLLVCFGRMSKNIVVRSIMKVYISIMRGTPLMLQLLVVYFGPFFIAGANISGFRFYAVIIGFSLNYAAYFAEIYRSGIESMPVGQYEAATVLGYSKSQTFIRIILPQVTNEIITLVKDTSLAFAIAYQEMFTIAKQITASNGNFTALFVAGLFYYIFNFIVAFVMERFEKKLSYYR